MRYTKLINTDVEVEMDITADDIIAAIHEQVGNYCLGLLAAVSNVLAAVGDDDIEHLTEMQRLTIAKFLAAHAERYFPTLENLRERLMIEDDTPCWCRQSTREALADNAHAPYCEHARAVLAFKATMKKGANHV